MNTRLSEDLPARIRVSGSIFTEEWIASDYLTDFYGGDVHPDEQHTIRHMVHTLIHLAQMDPLKNGRIIAAEIGCGPTVHHAIPLFSIPQISELHMYDLLPSNLFEVDKWLRGHPGAHDWNKHTEWSLKCENTQKHPTQADIESREHLVRQRVTRLGELDLGDPNCWLKVPRTYDLVVSPYCADSVTDDVRVYEMLMRNLARTVSPGGLLYVASLKMCTGYRVGSRVFSAANVSASMLRGILSLDFVPESIVIEEVDLPEHAHQGYLGILLAYAKKN
jgi:NNMT/PNMT/TEMT family